MANINLYQNEQEGYQKKQAGILGGGMAASIGFALLVLLVYGGVEFYLRSIDQKINDLAKEEEMGRQALKESDVNRAASFQQRVDKIRSGGESFVANDPAKIFEGVQKSVISGVVVSKIDFDGKGVNLSFVADDFETLSGQILSFKRSDIFTAVGVGSTSRSENGKITAALTLGLK